MSRPPPGAAGSENGAASWIAILVIAAALAFFAGPLLAHNALTEDYGCPEAPVAAMETCFDRQGFAGLLGPVALAVVLSLAAASVAGATDRRSAFRGAVVVASTILIAVFVWFLLGREIESPYAIAGATAWLAGVIVLATWFGWRPWQRVMIGVGATVGSVLVMIAAISAYG